MNSELRCALERAAARLQKRRLWVTLGLCWTFGGILAIGIRFGVSAQPTMSQWDFWLVGSLCVVAVVTGIGFAAWCLLPKRNLLAIARRIEAKYPELDTALLAVADEDSSPIGERVGYLRIALLSSVLHHCRSNEWDAVVSVRGLWAARIFHAVALAGLVLTTVPLFQGLEQSQHSGSADVSNRLPFQIHVDPGHTEIERGSPLLVVARFGESVPLEADLVVSQADRSELVTATTKMTRSLDDPLFAGRISETEADFTYHIAYASGRSESYQVTVFEYPEVLRADATLTFPSYTSLAPKLIEDTRHVTAVEGTELELKFHVNKKVESATLIDSSGGELDLIQLNEFENVYTASLKLTDSRRFRVELKDAEGRKNKKSFEFATNVSRNRPPVVKAVQPARDTRVSPVEELSLKGTFEDDFGVVRHGISYSRAGNRSIDIEFDRLPSPPSQVDADHLIDFEALAAEADELVTYFFWAEDIGPNGEPRRAKSDMYFAEVRPFEEIFRQGEQPAGGPSQQQQQQGGGNAQQAMQLAELQKQIISATWNLLRRGLSHDAVQDYPTDVRLIRDSQQSAIEQAQRLSEEITDQASRLQIEDAVRFMTKASESLGNAIEAVDGDSLERALASEQSAYQELLKLRDREFSVSRSSSQQQSGSSGSAGSPSQRQLDQLELKNDVNRYEQQRSAQSDALAHQQGFQQEMLQVLNRLRELAQRQNDLNERVKELQSSLDAVTSQEDRAELERQLKRLREQQQQMLRDADELREQMERESNRDRMAEARQQVEQSRENIRRASEALEEGRLSEALTEGTRASRQLEELQDAVRNQSANQFEQVLKDFRDIARRLEEAQDELTERLQDATNETTRSLTNGLDREQIQRDLQEQQETLETLKEHMRHLVEDAEETEPRLAEAMFEAANAVEEESVSQALRTAERFTQLGIPEEAAKASQSAGQGLTNLRESIEQASESVIGDEAAALQLAQAELEDLSRQLDDEIEQSIGDNSDAETNTSRSRQPGEDGPSLDRDRDDRAPQERADRDAPIQSAQESGARTSGSRQSTDPPQRSLEEGSEGSAPGADWPRDETEQRRSGSSLRPATEQSEQRNNGIDSQFQSSARTAGQAEPSDGTLRDEDPAGAPANEQRGGLRKGRENGQSRSAAVSGPNLENLLDSFNGDRSTGPGGPITGDGFRNWSDRMRSVEELLDDPELRAEVARVRERVRNARESYKRSSEVPDWTQLQNLAVEPLSELRNRVSEEIRRRQAPDSLVPIDRDPVPPEFAEDVRRYYERLGSGE